MSRASQRDREEFISIMTKEGVPLDVARKLLSAEATLHRIAELQCSSEAADRDQIKCPGFASGETRGCPCDDYGSIYRGAGEVTHGKVPRINVQEARLQKRILRLANEHGISLRFNSDPRGPAILVTVPSGRTNDWGQRGVVVP
jgi:hypothetical protein